jgi:hypothetical protein
VSDHPLCIRLPGSVELAQKTVRDDSALLASLRDDPSDAATAIEVAGLTRRFGDLEAV